MRLSYKIFLLLIFFSVGVSAQKNAAGKAENLEEAALRLIQNEQYAEALQPLNKIIAESGLKYREDYKSLYRRAICYFYLEEFDLALNDLNLFIGEIKDMPQPYIMRALIYRSLNENRKQVSDLNSAIALPAQEDISKLYRWRASALMGLGSYDSAEVDIRKSMETEADAEGYASLAFIQYTRGDYASAIDAINKAIEIDYTYLPAYLYATSFSLQKGDYNQALIYSNLGLMVDDQQADLLFYKGVSYIELNNIDAGCSLLNKAFYLGNDDAGDYLSQYCYPTEN
jgi:tetratricopeptide (TPR) repeat protein